ncbi:Biogenesis of lysosome-related organelles complex 1 subunit 2 [Acorus calamus]|uniref:Biogenesis of lysosome-related organelles complex 1 subunit 2 n=1 Tax=Acorus calamus TaxID=4465 RepID=A0AAV9D9N4_ACOCL|nr:Biogenesis of lysosome-related organelles complex 1 subunit 2 [Acorus calamus]
MEVVSQRVIGAISGGKFGEFIFKPSLGASGGIIIGWDERRWRKVDSTIDEFSISVVLEDRVSLWQWVCSSVYGPNQDDDRGRLWVELSAVRARWGVPGCIVGDFNVTRFVEDRNRDGVVSQAMEEFSEWIDLEGLIDLPLANLSYTWSSMRTDPSLAKLDRALVDPDWEEAFLNCSLKGLPRGKNNLLQLIEKMNLRVADEYKGFGDIASGLRVFVEQLNKKNGGFDEYAKQIDSIDQQVTEFEAVVSMLDKYVSLLESKVQSAYQTPPA